MVTLTRKSMITGEMNTMTLDTTQEKIDLFFTENDRPLIQDLFPELTVDEREFIQTGCTPEDWDDHISDAHGDINGMTRIVYT